jgi:hypothetical protein
MHPARGTMTATETAPARRVAAGRASAPRRHRAVRLALAAATAPGCWWGWRSSCSAARHLGTRAGRREPGLRRRGGRGPPAAVGRPDGLGDKAKGDAARSHAEHRPVHRHARETAGGRGGGPPLRDGAARQHLHVQFHEAAGIASGDQELRVRQRLGRLGAAEEHDGLASNLPLPGGRARPARSKQRGSGGGRRGGADAGVGPAAASRSSRPSTSVTAGSSATFTAAAAGSAMTGVQWQLSSDGGNYLGPDRRRRRSRATRSSTALAESGHRYRAVFASHGRSTSTSRRHADGHGSRRRSARLAAGGRPARPADRGRGRRLGPADHSSSPTTRAQVVGSSGDVHGGWRAALPTPTVQWQVSTDGGNTWAPVSGAHLDELHGRLRHPAAERVGVRSGLHEQLRLADNRTGHTDRLEWRRRSDPRSRPSRRA